MAHADGGDGDVDVNVWQDRQVKFDIYNLQNRLHNGESVLDVMDDIEDTKGNPRDSGRLLVTNLRIIWYSLTSAKFNLSIGLACIRAMSTKSVLSRSRGTTQALHIITQFQQARFEFIFTNMAADNARQFPAVFAVHKLYLGSALYRELKLRGSVVSAGQLRTLAQEQLYSRVPGVWNLSSDQGNLGTFIATNVRLVWFADCNELFNISLPFMQIAAIRVRDSKYGPALVLHTLPTAGNYVLGFRIDPPDRLRTVYQELRSLYAVHGATPEFGVFYEPSNGAEAVLAAGSSGTAELARLDDEPEIGSLDGEINTKMSAYLADCQLNGRGLSEEERLAEPVFSEELGFAIEPMPDGYALRDLWEIVPSSATVVKRRA